MSQYAISATDPRYDVVCGWDPPLQTLWAQVWDTTVPPGTEADAACLLWVGLTKRVETVAALQTALAAYVTLPAALVAQLEKERAQAGSRLVRPRRPVPRREALALEGPPPTGRAAATPAGGGACGAATHSARAVTTARDAPCVVTAPRRPGKSRQNKGMYT